MVELMQQIGSLQMGLRHLETGQCVLCLQCLVDHQQTPFQITNPGISAACWESAEKEHSHNAADGASYPLAIGRHATLSTLVDASGNVSSSQVVSKSMHSVICTVKELKVCSLQERVGFHWKYNFCLTIKVDVDHSEWRSPPLVQLFTTAHHLEPACLSLQCVQLTSCCACLLASCPALKSSRLCGTAVPVVPVGDHPCLLMLKLARLC
jgi:hypothetical protein